ncbi:MULTISPECIES: hypothetical protein [unclassified Streptomyces]|uniref:hypothetical protein n=1 Tax=unclassified Streptomyces TaxID=2593676 RepID=UPI002E808CC8|nr:hypothetical protein [Streptomyces sp. NBC_00589]WTI38120.1 hypothetical protein OIC96_25600 [Streptomyces sp. NBC_00775]WUB28201.1 hypothetical protein OHA51_24135 [Streptomyces sp. NBC_00589]
MATPPPHPNTPQGNPFAPQGGYAPNGAPAYGSYGTQDAYGAQNSAYGQNPAYGQYPQPPAPAPAAAGDYAYQAAPPLNPACRICAAQPARDMTIRQHTGLLVAMRFSKMEGPFCRSCATAIHREMTTKTLAGGWWSPVSLIAFTPLTLLWNLYVRTKIRKLPRQAMPSPTGIVMDQGKPIAQRPLAYVFLLLPLLWLAVYFSN